MLQSLVCSPIDLDTMGLSCTRRKMFLNFQLCR